MSQSSQFSLLKQRRFAPFFWTQFLGAFNDNVFKTAFLVVLTFDAATWTTLDPSMLTNLIPGLFILPYVLFSATAGQIAEKVEKGRLARIVKLIEILIKIADCAEVHMGFEANDLIRLRTQRFERIGRRDRRSEDKPRGPPGAHRMQCSAHGRACRHAIIDDDRNPPARIAARTP